ncbi:MAG: TIGR00159 family protein [Myxococcales bacterium]|nr:TIGR00159 family protein [Myxococcales bacterium]
MIETLWALVKEFWENFQINFEPVRDSIDIALVAAAIYWVLALIRGTRAGQILVGLIALFTVFMISQIFQLVTVSLILDTFLSSLVVILVILFQHDIRRALARVGRGLFPSVSAREESEMLEEIVRASQALSRRRIGALVVIERETQLADEITAGTPVDAVVSAQLLTSVFLPQSPLHDGAVIVQEGRLSQAGCILPLTTSFDLPEGVGTRHRAALGVSQETDALVVVVSEETGVISLVFRGEIAQGLDAPRLRETLRAILNGERNQLSTETGDPGIGEVGRDAAASARLGSTG